MTHLYSPLVSSTHAISTISSMGRLILVIAVFLAAVLSSLADQDPCSGNGCSNFTLYLGPRWGSKTIQYPNYPKIGGPNEKEVEILNKSKVIEREGSNITGDIISTRHRPVPDDNSFHIDYNDTPTQGHNNITVNTTSALLKIGNIHEHIVEGTLNLTNLGIQVEDVKAILKSLDKDGRDGLHRLYLNRNPLRYLYDEELLLEFARLTNLKVLGLSGTYLRGLIPFDHPSLEVLDLSNNFISQLSAINFNMPNLRELDLSNNRMNALFYSFSNLHNLRVLSLADNDMFLMSTEVFTSLNLQKLYLNNNKFHMIYQIMVDPSTSPNVSLYLSGNPLECDCYLQENLINHAWPKVADWDQLTCTDNTDAEPRLVSTFAGECQGFIASLKLIPHRFESGWSKLHFFLRRMGVPSPDDFIIYSGLLISVLFAWLAFRMRRQNLKNDNTTTAAKATVPYTILDSKHMP